MCYGEDMPRPSHVRTAIFDLVTTSERHDWSIEDVVAALTARGIPADFSSAFRGLAHLAREGLVHEVVLGDGRRRYEAANEHHEHVRCDRCGVISAVPGCSVERAHAAAEQSTGFRITGHQLLFSGMCPACSTLEGT